MIEFTVVALFNDRFWDCFLCEVRIEAEENFITIIAFLCVLCELQAKAEETVESLG